jgi:hypothetical protein
VRVVQRGPVACHPASQAVIRRLLNLRWASVPARVSTPADAITPIGEDLDGPGLEPVADLLQPGRVVAGGEPEFTWTPASPRKRFCSVACRHHWWNCRRRRARAAATGSEPAAGEHDARAGTPPRHDARAGAPRGQHDPRAGEPRGSVIAAVPACPHCCRPVAVVAWLVPPAAASIDTPRHAGNNL